MNLLRTVLLMLLVCAVPATALAGVLHEGRCQRGAPAVSTQHAGPAMQGEHSMHAYHQMVQGTADSGESSPTGSCQCGCSCGGIAHCGVGVGAWADDTGPTMLHLGRDSCAPVPETGQALAGHPGDSLRPPSMS